MPAPTVFNRATGQLVHGAAIANPAGGVTADTQARAATNAILAVLRNQAIIAGATSLNVGQEWNGNRIVQSAAVANPAGGVTVDAQVRTAINAILAVLRAFGAINGDGFPTLVLDEDTHAWSTAAIADPAGGTPADAECRAAISAALTALRSRNLISQD